MARIYTRGNILWLTYSINGKRERESLGLKDSRENRKLAKRIKLQREAEIINGIHPTVKKARRKTLDECYQEFLKAKENRSERTIELYKYAYNKFSGFVGKEIELVKIDEELLSEFEKHIEYYKTKKKSTPKKTSKNTIEIIFRQVRIMFEFFKKKKYIEENPIPKKEKILKKINTIPKEELDLILSKLKKKNHQQYRTIRLLLMTGLRASELIRLEWQHIDFKRNLIYITNTKGRREDSFPLYRTLRNFLLDYWMESERKGKVVSYVRRDSLRFFRRFLEENKFKHYTIHELRKTFLTTLANSGIPLFDLQKISRHKNIRTTEKYYLAADYNRIGERVNDVINDTIKDTAPENNLKIV